jgi:hypothetical protein
MNEPARVSPLQARLALASQISFWIQAVLGVIAILLWVVFLFWQLGTYRDSSSGAWLAFWMTVLALASLAASVFYTWRYLWRKKRRTTLALDGWAALGQLQPLIYVTLAGVFLSMIGLEAQVGELLARLFFRTQSTQFSGVLLLAANLNVTLAHLVTLTSLLWTCGVLDRKPQV